MEKKIEYIGKDSKEKQLFNLFINRLSDVTLLSLVPVEIYSIRGCMRPVDQSKKQEDTKKWVKTYDTK